MAEPSTLPNVIRIAPLSAAAEPHAVAMPHNQEVEQALLGALLVNNNAYEKVSDFLQPEHFYDPAHSRIFATMLTLMMRGQIADARTLRGIFDQDPALQSSGGGKYLADLAANVVSFANVEDYGHIIHDLYLRRQLILLGDEISTKSKQLDAETRALHVIEQTEASLFSLASNGEAKQGFVHLIKPLNLVRTQAELAFKSDRHITGVTTGMRDLDEKLSGLQPSDLVILAGRPSMGKTALVTDIAFNAARRYYETKGKEGAAVAFFSLEMSAEQLARRLLSSHTRIKQEDIQRGRLKSEDFTAFLEAATTLSNVPLFIDDSPGLTITALRTRARRMKRQIPGLNLIVIDYLQLMTGGANRREENRVQEISEISRGLKILAKELNIPVIALSQLSRGVESREEKVPMLSDLRESGSIEQDADVVMFVYREQYYHERAEPKRRDNETEDKFNNRYQQWQERGEQVRNVAEVIISKQRHGPTGKVHLHFDGSIVHFSDLDKAVSAAYGKYSIDE